MLNLKNQLLSQSKNKNFNLYVLVFTILFLSQFVFLYDEEKIIALCLISFIVIFYNNTSEVIYSLLNEKALALETEFVSLFKDKIIIMNKLRTYWRLFLDLEDQTIEIFCWIKKSILNIIEKKKNNRKYLINYFLKDKYNNLLIKNISIFRNFQLTLLALLKNNLLNNKKNMNIHIFFNNIKSLNNSNNQKLLIVLNKLNLNKINNYLTYYYLKFK